jgi:hypothetical protein
MLTPPTYEAPQVFSWLIIRMLTWTLDLDAHNHLRSFHDASCICKSLHAQASWTSLVPDYGQETGRS